MVPWKPQSGNGERRMPRSAPCLLHSAHGTVPSMLSWRMHSQILPEVPFHGDPTASPFDDDAGMSQARFSAHGCMNRAGSPASLNLKFSALHWGRNSASLPVAERMLSSEVFPQGKWAVTILPRIYNFMLM